MKNVILVACLLLTAVALPEMVAAQKYASLDKSPTDIAYFRPGGRNAVPIAKVTYNRPQKKGREMIGGKEPYGKIWRLGADEATEVKLYKDVTIGGKSVKAGTYTLYAIPNADKWTLIINKKLDTWGAYSYDESLDVARVDMAVTKLKEDVEAFSIAFHDGKMYFAWEKFQASVEIK